MRLGLLGPAGGDVAALGRAAEFLLGGVHVNRAIYLGVDGALDRAVAAWARKLVGDDPSDEHSWKRAADVAEIGSAGAIHGFVACERARIRLKSLEALPERRARTIEMLGDRVALLIHDKALLDEEDILAANLLFFGKSDGPLIKKIGTRWFCTPGPIGSAGGGVAVLDDESDDVTISIFDSAGVAGATETLNVARAMKMRVQGDA